ncbi:MAG: thioredoxin domain-containing protein [Desulfobacterales bacterium]
MTEHQTKPNRLIHEKSPYLLQHAYNPVDWYPWGDEAFEKSKSENKPILLSIGYSTCHWCHVMEEESFMDLDIAELMNDNFVCIKVDREERPDLDKIYITAVSALIGSAGWPLNVFLTSELEPFYGGTYFPPKAQSGMLSWTDLLKLISTAWNDPSKKKKLLSSGQELSRIITNHLSWSSGNGPIDTNLLDNTLSNFSTRFDREFGGFSPAPKFPSPSIQNFLYAYYFYAKNNVKKDESGHATLEMANVTLRAMATGGIYDQLGGGFHRYSTDTKWHVPHFEKMLYDNAQLLKNYLDAFLITRDTFFENVARETADYVLRDMTHPDGGFYSAEDADSIPPDPGGIGKYNKKIEGAFYVWEQREIHAVLGPEPGEIFSYHYGIQPKGNVEYDPHGDFTDKNILFAAHSLDETADKFSRSKNDISQMLKESRIKLLQVRAARPRPHLDDKILTSWNGLMISALSRAYQVLEDERYLTAARKAAEFIQKNLYHAETKLLYRRWRNGERKIVGMASDYAFLIQGLMDLYEADFDPGWLEWSLELMDEQITLFYDRENGGFFMTRKGHDKKIDLRVKEDTDSVIPSAGSVAVLNAMRLERFADSGKYSTVVEQTLKSVLSRINSQPDSAPELLVALIISQLKQVQVILDGDRNAQDTRSMLRTVNSFFIPGKTVMLVDNTIRSRLARQLPFISWVKKIDNKTTAYVCMDKSCKPPVTDPEIVRSFLN